MKKYLAVLVTASIVFVSCESSNEKTASDRSDNNATRNLQPPPVTPASVTPTNNSGNNSTAPITAPTNTATGLNPAHGQPGHRCDIPVGTPLSQAPKSPATVSTTPTVTAPTVTAPQVMTTPTVQNTTTTSTAPGMNPAHGQPGHRCDIPVGQPLNSKPATTVSTVPVKTN